METEVIKKWFYEKLNKEHSDFKLLTREGEVKQETEKAVLLELDAGRPDEKWIGKTQIWIPKKCLMTAADIAVENEENVNKRLGL